MKYLVSKLRRLFYSVLEINVRIILKAYCILFINLYLCINIYKYVCMKGYSMDINVTKNMQFNPQHEFTASPLLLSSFF